VTTYDPHDKGTTEMRDFFRCCAAMLNINAVSDKQCYSQCSNRAPVVSYLLE